MAKISTLLKNEKVPSELLPSIAEAVILFSTYVDPLGYSVISLLQLIHVAVTFLTWKIQAVGMDGGFT